MLSSGELLDELRLLREGGRATNADLARLLALPSARIVEIFDGKRRVTIDEMKLLVEHYGIGATAARLAPTDMARAPDQPLILPADGGETVEIIQLDLSLPMGPGATVDDYIEETLLRFDLAYIRGFTRTAPHRLRIARGVGDSMLPTLNTSDMVWIDSTQTNLNQQDRVWAVSINGAAAIKRLRPLKAGRVMVISDNPTIENYEVGADELLIGGRVIRFARDL